jgi:hypothetical protein
MIGYEDPQQADRRYSSRELAMKEPRILRLLEAYVAL